MTSKLLSPVDAGALHLRNRLVMAPLTRCRAEPGHVPGELIATYYAQRANAGLILTEATMIAADGCAFISEPGIYNDAQIAGWQRVTRAVHDAGGLIALQLWHPGRATHPVLNGGTQPVSSSDKPIRDSDIHTTEGKKPYPPPRRLATEELPAVVAGFRRAAENARQAGFDAVEIHGAHGYLIDQFLRDGVNDRRDAYGGSIANRARLLLEVTDAVVQVFGAERVGVRISPLVSFNDMSDSDPTALVTHVATELDRRRIAFLDLRHEQHDRPEELALAQLARRLYRGTLMLNGGFTQASGEAALDSGLCDAIIYGRLYIANPDLAERFRQGGALNEPNPKRFYSPGPAGYTDYPRLGT
jgi:N-ethylmaleimide reductase